jgi:alpha-N-arabinofuranosidase
MALCLSVVCWGGASAAVSVSADPAQVIRTIDPFFFGANVEWPEMAKGLVDPATGVLDPALVDLMRPIGLGSVRFLGNDFYRWEVAVGPIAQRGDNYDPNTDMDWPGVFGPDEVAVLCQNIGAQAIVSVNAGTGTAAEAASLVQYTNVTMHRAVNWWEIGNEPYYCRPDLPPFDQIYRTPEQYSARVREYVQAMKAVDPTIRLGVGAALDTGNYQTLYHPDWNQRVLPAVADVIDFVALHNGYAPLTDDTIDMRDPVQRGRAYAALLAAPAWVAENVRLIRQQINQAAGARANQIAIAVTEYAPIFGVARLEDVDQTRTLGCALYVADMLRAYLAEPSVVTAQYIPVIDRWFGAPIRNGYDQRVISPVYWVFQLFNTYFGRTLVSSSVTGSPTYSVAATGIVPPRIGVPYVTAHASLDPTGNTVYVMLVNKHNTSSQKTTISVRGRVATSAQASVLTGPAMNAINGSPLSDTTMTAASPIGLTGLGVQVTRGVATVNIPPRSVTAVAVKARART